MTTVSTNNDPNLDGDAYTREGFIRFSKTQFLHSGNADRDEVAKLILNLAAIYNQLKDLQELIVIDLEKLKSVVRGFYPKAGHLVGRHELLSRMLYGSLHELLVFLDERSRGLESDSFTALVESLDQETQRNWKTLLDAAKGRRAGKGIEHVLLLVRNNAAFHIQNPDNFAKGLELSIVSSQKHSRIFPRSCDARSFETPIVRKSAAT